MINQATLSMPALQRHDNTTLPAKLLKQAPAGLKTVRSEHKTTTDGQNHRGKSRQLHT
eukprot:m.132000 g.132000  ORF g.132000 m.132000 type:complete len:58 (+) comp16837_c0_seq3:1837-2010(+)